MRSKNRAQLKSLAQTLDASVIIGKSGLTENLIKQIDVTLEKRELVKVSILNNNMDDRTEMIDALCDQLQAELVQQIGNKVVLYRRNEENPVISLSHE